MKRFLALAALGALLVGCSKASNQNLGQGERHSWTQPGILRVAIQQDVKDLNPLLSSNTTDVFIDRLMFEPLITADPKGNPLPMLVTGIPSRDDGGISPDGLTITYHLRKDVKWTDGVAVTSKDVKWSWQAIMNSNNDVVSRNGYDDIASIDTPDDWTVVVHLKEKFSPFVNTFFAESDSPLMIAPAHVLAKYSNINEVPFNGEPTVSDGPFRFAEWSRGDHIEVTRNDGFFLGKPGLDRVLIKIIPDENTSVNELRAHEIDYIFQASIHTYQSIKTIPDVNDFWLDVNGYTSLQLNLARPFLKDVRVRRAIAFAIDKQKLVDTLTVGQDKIATADIPYWMWAHDSSIPVTPFDVAKAKELLAQAGWTPGPDGIARKDGHRLTLVLVSDNSNATRRQAAVQIQSMLRQAGINAEIKFFPGEQLFAPAGMGGILQLGKFDLSLAGWYAGIDPDDSSQFTCKNFPPGGYNYPRYCSPAMEAAQHVALTRYRQSERKAAYDKIQQLLTDDVPEIFFWYERQQEPISVDFKGFAPNPVVESWNAWQWSI